METELSLQDKNDYLDLPQDYLDSFCDFIPTEVCHYTTKEKATEKILDSKKIRLGQLGFTNDPRESKDWYYLMTMWDSGSTRQSIQNLGYYNSELKKEANRIKRQEWRVLCMACHNNPNLNFYGGDKKEYDLHEYGFGHSRMWAQYADNHTGVCLIFDGRKLDENIRGHIKVSCQIFHGLVRYDYDKSVAGNQAERNTHPDLQVENLSHRIRKYMVENYDSFFLYKSEEWKTEHEFRWLIHTEDTSEILIPIESALKAIIAGVDYPEMYELNLKVAGEEINIPVGKITWENGMPWVYKDKIFKPR